MEPPLWPEPFSAILGALDGAASTRLGAALQEADVEHALETGDVAELAGVMTMHFRAVGAWS